LETSIFVFYYGKKGNLTPDDGEFFSSFTKCEYY